MGRTSAGFGFGTASVRRVPGMGGGWVLRLPVVASELSITTMSPVVCRGGGLAGNNLKTSVLLLRFLRVPNGNCSQLTKQILGQIGNKKTCADGTGWLMGDSNSYIHLLTCTPCSVQYEPVSVEKNLKLVSLLHSFGENGTSGQNQWKKSWLLVTQMNRV